MQVCTFHFTTILMALQVKMHYLKGSDPTLLKSSMTSFKGDSLCTPKMIGKGGCILDDFIRKMRISLLAKLFLL